MWHLSDKFSFAIFMLVFFVLLHFLFIHCECVCVYLKLFHATALKNHLFVDLNSNSCTYSSFTFTMALNILFRRSAATLWVIAFPPHY